MGFVLPDSALAHVTISPTYVEADKTSTIRFETPNERPPHATTALSVTAPPGIAVDGADAPAGWHARVNGSTVTWSGGRIEGRTTVRFPLRITARVRAGTRPFAAAQRYDDGATVKWNADLSVLPAAGAAAPQQHPWGALAAAVAGVAVIGGSVFVLRRVRRAPLQER